MNTTWGDLPGLPSRHNVNVTQQGDFGEAAFDSMYRRFKDTEHYEDAKKAFLSPSLNKGLISGVNTWHEQVLAGRVTLDDIKTMGYTNLARHRAQTDLLLEVLTRDRMRMTAAQVKIALTLTRTSYLFGLNPPMRDDHTRTLPVTLEFVLYYSEDAKRVRYHADIKRIAGRTLRELHVKDYPKALEILVFVDEFLLELQQYIAVGKVRTYDDKSYPVLYKNKDFVTLLDAGVTPAQAAKSLIQGLSAERAVVVKESNVPDSLVDGAL